jgi:hypothetical protein
MTKGKENNMKRKLLELLCVMIIVISLISLSGVQASAKKGEVNVHQLANRVRKVIKVVEKDPTIPCETRNHLVRRLRSVNDALESGNRSAARALVIAWKSEFRSHQRFGLLSAEHGSILHKGLHGFLDEIGIGATDKPGPIRKWKPLPVCDSEMTAGAVDDLDGLAATAGSSYEVFDPNDALTIVRSLTEYIPVVGTLLSGVEAVLWPANSTDMWYEYLDQKIDEAIIRDVVQPALDGLQDGLSPYDGWGLYRDRWLNACKDTNSEECKEGAQTVYGAWVSMQEDFVEARSGFQTKDEDDQVWLLPMFAQYETLYLSFLRDGILLAPLWIASGKVLPEHASIPADIMAEELDPDFANPITKEKERGIAYVNLVYDRGLNTKPQPTTWDKWKTRNDYIRDYTLKVLDFRDTWKFFDPDAYPEGVEGGIKLTRMIYTDPIGHMTDDAFDKGWFQPPANVTGPLKELTVWGQRPDSDIYNGWNGGYLEYGSGYAISAVQSTNPPTAGPARSGNITGDYTHDGETGEWYRDLRVLGPITHVMAVADRRSGYHRWIPAEISLGFATGTWSHIGGYSSTYYAPYIDVQYPGHVLGAAGAMGRYDLGNGYATDAVIFGFRLYDSFFPSGALVNIRSGKCMDVISLAPGTKPTIYSCFSGNPPGQIWTYDTNTKAVRIGDPDLNLCLRATGTSYGSAVEINTCTGAKNEQWELVPSVDGLSGLIKSVESGLALDVAGGGTANRTAIVLWYPHGDTNQQWTITSQLKGEIHGVGSGRCLDVKDGNTADGTPVQIYDCNGTAAQTWTYDESARTLSVFNGTKCLNVMGSPPAPLYIYDCSGDRTHQEWVFNRGGTITHVATGYVMDVDSGSKKNERPVVLSLPVANRSSQRWSRPSRLGGNVHAMYAGKCLGLANLDNGTQTQIADCLASPAPTQEWTYHPLTKRFTVLGDGTEKCLSSMGTNSGAKVIIDDCGTDDPYQLWIVNHNEIGGTIASAASVDPGNPGSEMCMTLPGTGTVTASGTMVELQPCDSTPANPNQQWIWP